MGLEDWKFPEIRKTVKQIIKEGYVSTARIQRAFLIGYSKAARTIDELTNKGYIIETEDYKKQFVNDYEEEISAEIYAFFQRAINSK